ncbi:MAG: right-handed parallel beta-helix repeat-containing protein [Sedimentisphaeraceae bacterium JB056]
MQRCYLIAAGLLFAIQFFCGAAYGQDGQDISADVDQRHQYILSFCSPEDYVDHMYIGRLEVCDMENKWLVETGREVLDETWGITDRSSFLDVILWQVEKGYGPRIERFAGYISRVSKDKYEGMIAKYRDDEENLYRVFLGRKYSNMFRSGKMRVWDICNAISITRLAYTCGYIDEDEAWRMLEGLEIPKKMLAQYESWQDFYDHYLIARHYWSKEDTENNSNQLALGAMALSEMRYSPWQRYKDMKPAKSGLPDYFLQNIEVPDAEVSYPVIIHNERSDYKDAFVVSDSNDIYRAVCDKNISRIFVAGGDYYMPRPLKLGAGQSIIGAGRDKVVFRFRTEDDSCVEMSSFFNLLEAVTLTDESKKRCGEMILVNGSDCVIRNCRITETKKRGILISKGAKAFVDSCTLESNGGIKCSGGKLRLAGSHIEKSTSCGVLAAKAADVDIEGCNIIASKGEGIRCDKCSNVMITNNIVMDNEGWGIEIKEAENDFYVLNNFLKGNELSGVIADDCGMGVISYNQSHLNGYDGILVDQEGPVVVAGNRCYRNGFYGIDVTASNPDVSDNEAVNNNYSGIVCTMPSRVRGNRAAGNMWDGIELCDDMIEFSGNVIDRNMYVGVDVYEDVFSINIEANSISENLWAGIYIRSESYKVKISRNQINDNGAWPIVFANEKVVAICKDNQFKGNFQGDKLKVRKKESGYLDKFELYYGKLSKGK